MRLAVEGAQEEEEGGGVKRDFMGTFWLLLTVHINVSVSVFNQLDAQNLFHNKFYFMPLHVTSTRAHHQEVKIALHSLRYMCDDTRGCVMQFWPPDDEHVLETCRVIWEMWAVKHNFVTEV